MKNYIDTAVSRSRTTLSIFVAIMLTGFGSYLSIPVELNPDVEVPIIITTIIHEGISPEDAERLLAKPTEIDQFVLERERGDDYYRIRYLFRIQDSPERCS
jgi:multidrug efflux pump subunit AcrB